MHLTLPILFATKYLNLLCNLDLLYTLAQSTLVTLQDFVPASSNRKQQAITSTYTLWRLLSSLKLWTPPSIVCHLNQMSSWKTLLALLISLEAEHLPETARDQTARTALDKTVANEPLKKGRRNEFRDCCLLQRNNSHTTWKFTQSIIPEQRH